MIDALLGDFLVRAALAGIGAALVAGPLGCFVVWRRMAYFGDATAHSALLGVALGLAFDMPILLGALIVAAAMALSVTALTMAGRVAVDAMLGVFAHAALALGLVAISQMPGVRVDLIGYLFGDILAVTRADLAVIWGGAAVIGVVLWLTWSRLLNATISQELSVAEGDRPEALTLMLMLGVALIIAIAMQIVGLLLVTAMLILPAAAARPLSRTPEAMALIAAGIGVLGVLGGLTASYRWDSPAGPTIVVAVFALFCLSAAQQWVRR